MRSQRFEYWKSGKFYWWHLVGKNGEIIANGGGEGYSRKENVISAIALVQECASSPVNYLVTEPPAARRRRSMESE